MALTATSVTWNGLSIAGPSAGGQYQLRDIVGWDTTPNVSFASVAIAGGRGAAVTPGQMDPRTVTVTGWCFNAAARDSLLATFWSNAAPSVGDLTTDSLTVTHAGLTLSADAQLQKADASPEPGWAAGRFGFTLQWRCPDPMRYAPASTSVVAVKVPTLGITF